MLRRAGVVCRRAWVIRAASRLVRMTNAGKINDPWFGDVTYRNGPLFVGATYSNFGKGGDSKTDGHEWNIGAAYDFKGCQLVGLVYDSIRFNSMGFDWINTNSFIGDTDLDRDTWRLNVGVPITAKDSVYELC